jgi:hypothetical protein
MRTNTTENEPGCLLHILPYLTLAASLLAWTLVLTDQLYRDLFVPELPMEVDAPRAAFDEWHRGMDRWNEVRVAWPVLLAISGFMAGAVTASSRKLLSKSQLAAAVAAMVVSSLLLLCCGLLSFLFQD